jgi:hypothetical protein
MKYPNDVSFAEVSKRAFETHDRGLGLHYPWREMHFASFTPALRVIERQGAADVLTTELIENVVLNEALVTAENSILDAAITENTLFLEKNIAAVHQVVDDLQKKAAFDIATESIVGQLLDEGINDVCRKNIAAAADEILDAKDPNTAGPEKGSATIKASTSNLSKRRWMPAFFLKKNTAAAKKESGKGDPDSDWEIIEDEFSAADSNQENTVSEALTSVGLFYAGESGGCIDDSNAKGLSVSSLGNSGDAV